MSGSAKRSYSRAVRDEQVALSRHRVLVAADAAFLELGFAGTTVARVAAQAGVSVQTVYNVVGGKPELLKAAYDLRLAGDSEPVPIAQRPQIQALLAARDAHSCLRAYVALGRELGERTVPFLARLLPEAASDPGLRAFADTIEQERAVGAANVARHVDDHFGLRAGLTVDHAADILWSFTAPELADRLVNRRQWGWARFERWLGDTLTEALVGPTAT
jgi:AcrR family transcriptional regulator